MKGLRKIQVQWCTVTREGLICHVTSHIPGRLRACVTSPYTLSSGDVHDTRHFLQVLLTSEDSSILSDSHIPHSLQVGHIQFLRWMKFFFTI